MRSGSSPRLSRIDPTEHYERAVGPIEHDDLGECGLRIRNVGWTLGNYCPFRCYHCYSLSARRKGRDLTVGDIDRVVSELSRNGVETVNLGGNEPLFTSGPDAGRTLLPHIVERLVERGIAVGLTTAGVTLVDIARNRREVLRHLNDVDISFDSPYEEEHNKNRGEPLYRVAINCLQLCQSNGIEHTIIICAMNWNFTGDRIRSLVSLAKRYDANIRVNVLKPVQPEHLTVALSPGQFYSGLSLLMELCDAVDLSDPVVAAVCGRNQGNGCPCGRTSFRIHSITRDGRMPVSPCVYLHDYKVGNLLEDDLCDIVRSPQFRTFRRRTANPASVDGCRGCELINVCRGGCAARAYLYAAHQTGRRSLFHMDPFCPKVHATGHRFPDAVQRLGEVQHLVHQDYLCTWIGRPK